MKQFKALLFVVLLSACMPLMQQAPATPEQQALIKKYDSSLSKGNTICRGKSECDRLWGATQAFIQSHSDMKIQIASDTLIETYNPNRYGFLGFSANRTPSTISLAVGCKGIVPIGGAYFEECIQKSVSALNSYHQAMRRK